MKNRFLASLLCVIIFVFFNYAGDAKYSPVVIQKSALAEWKFFDVNSMSCTINSAGPYCDYLMTASPGLVWPKGTHKTAVFTAGIGFIGKHHPTDSLRTAMQIYQTEFQPGRILSTFNTTTNDISVAANPEDGKYRIYKINSNSNASNNVDYAEWPGDLGAPYEDVNKNGMWDNGIDTPKMIGDQMLWCVYNDLDTTKHKSVGTTQPMGIEVQATYFGFDKPGALGNTMFMKWRVINKSDAQYDSMFVGMYSDTDLGDGNDDIVGCDTARNLTYFFNGDNDDGTFNGYGSQPPADGFAFLQGPQIVSLSDSALVDGSYKKGVKNLSVSAHNIYIGGGDWNDPPLGQKSCPRNIFNNMVGRIGRNGIHFVNPVTNAPTNFLWPGDPVAGDGWTYSQSRALPTDYRSMISCGPFTFAPGDTQEIVSIFVIAQSSDRLASITLLRDYVDQVNNFYKKNFITGISQTMETPSTFTLEQNYPNPFNPATTIIYSLPVRSQVTLDIYSVLGERVKTLENNIKEAGKYTVEWNSTNESGSPVATGLYFYHITAGTNSMTKKMLLLK